MWRSLLIAGRFLTRLPLPDPGRIRGSDLGRSTIFYPLFGLVIGLLLWGLSSMLIRLEGAGPDLAAALVLVAWVWLTGGLHLDGLADTADAWIGGMGDRRRTLEILNDPGSGPFGVLALVLVLLCKWTAIATLIDEGTTAGLVWVPVLARAQLLVLFLSTPCARPEGMGARVAANLRPGALRIALLVSLGVPLLFLGTSTILLVLAGGLLFIGWQRSVRARLGGFTGDTAGALVELSETVLLLAVVLVP